MRDRGQRLLKAPVSERFSIRDGKAQWQNDAERGERTLTDSAFYISMQSVPEETALLAAALLKAPGQRLALLPEGEASLRRTDDATVSKGVERKRVMAYEITGLGFTPQTVWLDEGERFFAAVSSWRSFVLEGWEASAPQLLQQQDAVESKRTLEIARIADSQTGASSRHHQREPVRCAQRAIKAGSTVVIEGSASARSAGPARWPFPPAPRTSMLAGARCCRASGTCTCTWGRTTAPCTWRRGVTSVRDLANDNEFAARAREEDRARRGDRAAHHHARLHGRARTLRRPDQGVRGRRGGSAHGDRQLRAPGLRRHQDLQLDQARAGADASSAWRTRRACASAATCRRS